MISVSEFIKFLNESVENGTITSDERDNYMYDCAYAQSHNNDLQKLMNKIIEEVESTK